MAFGTSKNSCRTASCDVPEIRCVNAFRPVVQPAGPDPGNVTLRERSDRRIWIGKQGNAGSLGGIGLFPACQARFFVPTSRVCHPEDAGEILPPHPLGTGVLRDGTRKDERMRPLVLSFMVPPRGLEQTALLHQERRFPKQAQQNPQQFLPIWTRISPK